MLILILPYFIGCFLLAAVLLRDIYKNQKQFTIKDLVLLVFLSLTSWPGLCIICWPYIEKFIDNLPNKILWSNQNYEDARYFQEFKLTFKPIDINTLERIRKETYVFLVSRTDHELNNIGHVPYVYCLRGKSDEEVQAELDKCWMYSYAFICTY